MAIAAGVRAGDNRILGLYARNRMGWDTPEAPAATGLTSARLPGTR